MARTSGTRRGNGAGHGGPANGPGSPAAPFTADSETRETTAHLENGDAVQQGYRTRRRAERRERRQVKEERTLDLEDRLYDVAMGQAPDATANAVLAARSLHAIWNGQPVATNLNLTSDDIPNLTDDEIAAEIARLGGTGTETAPGDDAPGLPK